MPRNKVDIDLVNGKIVLETTIGNDWRIGIPMAIHKKIKPQHKHRITIEDIEDEQ